ncbi:unnamed protein product [Hermetia illucens]|uniref:Uncharacterized protein n=1 Tax=Hermetia illucens TaxID=343691 RepID=A0A7R8V2B2_HERIL|nr:unnamed protein product [Hermetia illucens]
MDKGSVTSHFGRDTSKRNLKRLIKAEDLHIEKLHETVNDKIQVQLLLRNIAVETSEDVAACDVIKTTNVLRKSIKEKRLDWYVKYMLSRQSFEDLVTIL